MDPQNLLIAITIIGARLLVPLLIPRFPLPAIIACLVIDGMDQTIFQKYTTIDLSNYQSYDKALDIYYLSIAYLSTMKNWTNKAAFKISQFLFYYRMIGVTLYEFYHSGKILFIFPNTFEYFFIFVSFVALFYNMKRLSAKFLLGTAAFIWIFIKLPQEYWIHIAKLDTTDLIKESILGVPATSTWSYGISQNMWVIPVVGIIALVLGIIIWKVVKRLPKPDHKMQVTPFVKTLNESKFANAPKSLFLFFQENRYEFAEKFALVGLIIIVFGKMLPTYQGTVPQLLAGLVTVILGNAIFSFVIMKSSVFNTSITNRFFPMLVLNAFLAFIYAKIISGPESQLSYLTILFLAYIVTLLTVFYDRFRPYYQEKFSK